MTHQVLLDFFQQVLNHDAGVIAQIENSKERVFFDQKTGALVFSLLSLYELLIEPQSVSFSEFKKSLYQGNFNQTLGEMGGVVSIYHSTGKIDGNLYQFNAIG